MPESWKVTMEFNCGAEREGRSDYLYEINDVYMHLISVGCPDHPNGCGIRSIHAE